MAHLLETKIEQFRRQARRLAVLQGLAWFVGPVILTAIVLGLADYQFRFGKLLW